MGKKITAEEFPQLWYHKKQIDCKIVEYNIKDNGSTIHLRIAPFDNEFRDIFSHKDYHNHYLTFFGENLYDVYSPLIPKDFEDHLSWLASKDRLEDIDISLVKIK